MKTTWPETVALLRKYVALYKTISEVSELIGIDRQTLKKAIDDHKPTIMAQLKIERWVLERKGEEEWNINEGE